MTSKDEIPEHWDWSNFGSEVYIEMGNSPPGDSYNENGNGEPFLQGASRFGDKYPSEGKYTTEPTKFCKKEDILITIRAGVGDLNIANKEYCIGRGIAALRGEESIKNDFLYYYLKALKPYWEEVSSGSTYSSITKTDIQNAPLPVPPLEEQKVIVEKLDEIFNSIEEIQDAHKQAEEIKNLLGTSAYKSIFDELLSTYSVVEVEEIADEIKNGGTPKRSEDSYWGGDIPWLKSGELNEGYISTSEENLTEKGLTEGSAKLMDSKTVLIAMYGATRGKTAILQEEMTTNQAICGVLVNEDKITPEYLQFCIKAKKRELVGKGRGGGQDNINQTTIKETKIPIPPLSLQEEILERIRTIENALERDYAIQREQIIGDLPKSVLTEAFKGDLVDFTVETNPSSSNDVDGTEPEIKTEGQQKLGEFD